PSPLRVPDGGSMRPGRSTLLLAPFISLGLLTAGLAAQQPDTTRRDSTPPPAPVVTLPPITLTATRTARTVYQVPLAVSQLDRRQLFGASGYSLSDALSAVPGVVAQSRYGSSDVRITIRGYGARGAGDRSNAGTSRGVRVLLDGFPETEPDGRTSFDGIDLAAAHGLEVVRSNASATWGNAAGGVISISTLPEFDRRFLGGEAIAGSFGLRRQAVRAGTVFGAGGTGGRLSASVVHTDFAGWRAHSASRRSLLNAALVAPVAEHTRLGVFLMGSANLFRIPGPLTRAQADSAPEQANATYNQRDERRDNRVGRLGVSLDHELGERQSLSGMLFLNPKSLQRSERGTFRDFTRYHLGGNLVYRLTTPLGHATTGIFVAGLDRAYQDGAILFYSLTAAGTRGDTLRDDKREAAGNLGLFVQEEVLVGRWGVILGARYDDIAYDYQNHLAPGLDARKSFTGVTPKLGVTYRPTPTHSLYASVGGGVEAPAGNETDPASTFGQDTVTALNPLLDPIRSTTYEVGTRQAVTFDHAGPLRLLSYDAALYQTDVRNEIVPYRGGRFYFTAGRVRRRGAELGLRLEAAGGVSLSSALAYAQHRYLEYVVDSVHYGRPGATADYAGNRVVGVPRFTYSASVGVAPKAWNPVRVQLGVQGMSAYFADDANAVPVPAYGVTTLTVGLAEPVPVGGGGLGVRGFVTVNNLFDRRYIASAFLNPDVVAGEPVAFEPGLARQLLVSLSLTTLPSP
ncbi:MAG: TonB-dependent receptor family protein, partial [Gemmatimonadales bacterium]